MLLDGRGLAEGSSSKKVPVPCEALSGGGKPLPVDADDTTLGRRGTGGSALRGGGSAPVNMLLLLGGGGRASAAWASEFGRICWLGVRFFGRVTSIGRS